MSVELWRKDFYLYYLHHFITIGLMMASYFMGLTRTGTAVLVEQVGDSGVDTPVATACVTVIGLCNRDSRGRISA